jgi:pimeloyl-ACP methyl ester carboxylesterase
VRIDLGQQDDPSPLWNGATGSDPHCWADGESDRTHVRHTVRSVTLQRMASVTLVAMQPDELRALGKLATRMAADGVSHVEQVHRAIAARVFTLTAPVSLPARVLHDGIAVFVYAAVRGVGRVAGMTASELAGVASVSPHPAGSTPASNLALAVLNATLGDELAAQGSPLAISMAIRATRTDISPRPDALAAAFPAPTQKMAVFLHGLGETEESWRLHAGRHGQGVQSTYGSRLASDFGYTPLYLRYNTGLHISENGRHLSRLLEEVVAGWPTPVDEVLLVGHSMGGLVARAACHQAQTNGDTWVEKVRHVVYLGTPHRGAALEQWVSRLSDLLSRLDEGRALAAVLNRRSAGIKDLQSGALLDDERSENTEAERRQAHDVPLLSSAKHFAISATITSHRRNPIGQLLGDLLVHPASARGGKEVSFPTDHKRHFGGLHHFDLLNHPAIYRAMQEWLGASPGPS